MPGHIGTSIAFTSSVLGKHGALELDEQEVADVRERYLALGLPVDNVPDDHIRQMVQQQQETSVTRRRLRQPKLQQLFWMAYANGDGGFWSAKMRKC